MKFVAFNTIKNATLSEELKMKVVWIDIFYIMTKPC